MLLLLWSSSSSSSSSTGIHQLLRTLLLLWTTQWCTHVRGWKPTVGTVGGSPPPRALLVRFGKDGRSSGKRELGLAGISCKRMFCNVRDGLEWRLRHTAQLWVVFVWRGGKWSLQSFFNTTTSTHSSVVVVVVSFPLEKIYSTPHTKKRSEGTEWNRSID